MSTELLQKFALFLTTACFCRVKKGSVFLQKRYLGLPRKYAVFVELWRFLSA
jgi:hypothetical protein